MARLSFITGFFKNKYILSLVSNGTNALIGMLTLSLLLRALPLSEMGDWAVFLTTLLFFDTLRSGFLTTAFIKFYAGVEASRQREISGSAWYIAMCITGGFMLVNIPLYFLSDKIDDSSIRLFLKYFGLNYLLSLPFFMANCVLQGKQRFDLLLILNFSNQGSFLLLIIVMILLKHINIEVVVYCYLASNLLASTLALMSGWAELSRFKYRTRAAIMELFHFGKFNVGTNVTSSLLSLSNTFIVKFFLGSAALAIYNAGSKLIQVVELPLRSFVYTAMPSLASHYNMGHKEDVLLLMKKYIGMLTVALLPVSLFMIIFADYAILILGGEKYVSTEAPNILRIFMVTTLIYPTERFFALTLDVIHLPKVNFMKVLVMILVSAISDLLAVYLTGSIYGISMASVFCTLTGLLIGNYALNHYYIRFNFWSMYRNGYTGLVALIRQTAVRFFK